MRRSLVPALGFAAIAFIFGAGGYLSEGRKSNDTTPSSSSESQFVRGVVQSISSDRLTLTTDAGTRELRLANGAAVEALRPTSFDRITQGDWINGGAVGHAQTLFALVGIVVIPQSQLESR